jgi:predicted 2-oxoglutarate/Fe(II)-dependent dioxygenase YbiX/peroxiredoxin
MARDRSSTVGKVQDPARRAPLGIGEAAPWFHAPVLDGSDRYSFDTAGGRAVLLLFLGSAGHAVAAGPLMQVQAKRALFDDDSACFFGITVDPADAATGRIRPQLPGIRFVLDYDRAVSRAFGAVPDDAGNTYRPHWLLLDRTLRVAGIFPLVQGAQALAAFEQLVASAPAPDWAPVAMVPNIFEPEVCRTLVGLYEADGGQDSGFMRDVGGKTKLLLDPAMKVRRDCAVEDEKLMKQLDSRMLYRLRPMVRRVFQFEASRIERRIVGCYEAESGGHFRPHRDNTTRGTAHRRFAVTINLNAEEYEGGDLRFPEFGRRTYRAPTGGAIVFSCSLLHQALPVTRGRRFAYLPFLYDDEAARIRERNAHFLEGEAASYRAARDAAGG